MRPFLDVLSPSVILFSLTRPHLHGHYKRRLHSFKMRFTTLSLLSTTLPLVSAIHPPTLNNLTVSWFDDFSGCQGCPPNSTAWKIALRTGANNEDQQYTTESTNVQLSGGDTLQLVPWKSDTGEWTSGRVETQDSFTPQPGKLLRIQGGLRMGNNTQKQGIWPAFWMLGESMRQGTPWPTCGEIDVLEQINGDMTAHGTVHCGDAAGGLCNEPTGLAQTTEIPDNDWHDWAVVIDRTSGNWETETISWSLDGHVFHVLKGGDLGDQGHWATVAHSPMYILLNVAVGGNWPVSYSSFIKPTRAAN